MRRLVTAPCSNSTHLETQQAYLHAKTMSQDSSDRHQRGSRRSSCRIQSLSPDTTTSIVRHERVGSSSLSLSLCVCVYVCVPLQKKKHEKILTLIHTRTSHRIVVYSELLLYSLFIAHKVVVAFVVVFFLFCSRLHDDDVHTSVSHRPVPLSIANRRSWRCRRRHYRLEGVEEAHGEHNDGG